MPYEVIPGRFFCVNYSPDGDTVRFRPDDPAMLGALGGVPVQLNLRGHASIRFEGIDSLETHFEGRHQPGPFAAEAADRMLAELGFANVVWNSGRSTVVAADNDGVPGAIAARATDKFGRIVAFVYPAAGAPPAGKVFLQPAQLDASINARHLEAGLAYATFYSSLFAELRAHLATKSRAARQAGRGLHALDVSETGFEVAGMGSLTDEHVILPKLFRRASVYVEENGSIIGFRQALEMNREPVLDLKTANFTHFDTFIEQEGLELRLLRAPEDMVFDPMPERPGGDFTLLLQDSVAMA